MKKTIYRGIENLEVTECPIPDCPEDGIVVRNLCAAICGSDVFSYYHGAEFEGVFPGDEFGHEMISEVVKIGHNISDVKIGDRLYPFPLFARGDTSRAGSVGGYSEYFEMPHFKLGMSAFKIDDSISNIEGSLIEPLTVGHHAAKVTHPTKESHAVVFGAGMIGCACAIALKYMGVEKVMITDISPKRLEIASHMGVEVCNVASEDYLTKAKDYFGEEMGMVDADLYIEASGVKSNLDLFMNSAKRLSTLCITSVFHEPVTLDLMKLNFSAFTIIGSPAYDIEDVLAVLEMLKSHQFPIKDLVTHTYRIDDINEAFEKAADSKDSLKVVIDYQ